MATVRIPTVLRKHTDGQATVAAEGDTVGEVFDSLIASHPGLGDQLLDDDGVRGFINVYVEDEDIRYIDGLSSPVEDDDEVAIMPAVAGGAQPEASTHGARGHAGGAQPEASTHGARGHAGGSRPAGVRAGA